ncbi:10660_t:CDS:2 [Entrophospora sp. SA101]|nr:10660_t:CDS:2 [Entrophospora sp. SA101]
MDNAEELPEKNWDISIRKRALENLRSDTGFTGNRHKMSSTNSSRTIKSVASMSKDIGKLY